MATVQTFWSLNGKDLTWYMHRQRSSLTPAMLETERRTLRNARQQFHLGHGPLLSSNVEASSCALEDKQLAMIMQILLDEKIQATRLKFFDNKISSVLPIVTYLNSPHGKQVTEIHLSHNVLNDRECARLIDCCASNAKGQRKIWLRLENNSMVHEPEKCLLGPNSRGKVGRAHRIGQSDIHNVIVHSAFFSTETKGKGKVGKGSSISSSSKGAAPPMDLKQAINSSLSDVVNATRKRRMDQLGVSVAPGPKFLKVDTSKPPITGKVISIASEPTGQSKGKGKSDGPKGATKGKGKGDGGGVMIKGLGWLSSEGTVFTNIATDDVRKELPKKIVHKTENPEAPDEKEKEKKSPWLMITASELANPEMRELFPQVVVA